MALKFTHTPLAASTIDIPWRREPLCLFSPAERDKITNAATAVSMPPGAHAYNANDRPDSLYFVLSGKFKTLYGSHDRQQILKISGPLEFVGFRSILASERHSSSLIALEPSILITIPRRVFMDAVSQNPRLATHLVKAMAVELRQCRQKADALTRKQVRGRLADSILSMLNKFGYAHGSQRLDISLSREDWAAMSNMTTANAIRTLSAFANEGIIQLNKRDLTILNEDELRKTSEVG